jgi:hypothetical protein
MHEGVHTDQARARAALAATAQEVARDEALLGILADGVERVMHVEGEGRRWVEP